MADWVQIEAEAALYVHRGVTTIVCDRLPRPVTLLVKLERTMTIKDCPDCGGTHFGEWKCPFIKPAPEALSADNDRPAPAVPETVAARRTPRDKRQAHVSEWCSAAFGRAQATSIEQRGLRLAEEAIEAAQAAGCDPATLHKLIDYIYSRPVGEMARELGGVGLCLLAMASAAGIRADEAEQAELERVLAKPLAFFAARNKVKNDAGFVAADTEAKSQAQ